ASPPVQVRTGLPDIVSQPGQCGSSGARTTTAPETPGWANSAASACAISGRPAAVTYCLRSSPPKRVPRPAAGTITQVMRARPAAARAVRCRARRSWLLVPGRPRRRIRGPRHLLHHAVEGLARADHAQLAARAFLDRGLARLEVLHLRGQH